MHAHLDALLTSIYVLSDDFLQPRSGPGRPPLISDAELITLAIAQVFLGIPNDRQFLAMAGYRLGHLFPYLPKQSGYNKRLRRLTPEIERTINYLAFNSPGFYDELRLLDSTPVPCAQSRETARRSALGRIGGYGYCRSHSRYFWGFRLYLLSASERRSGARVVDGRSRRRLPAPRPQGRAAQLRPARPDPAVDRVGLRHLRGQLGIERHGARTLPGLCARVGLRLLALAAGLWHNAAIGRPARSFAAYGH